MPTMDTIRSGADNRRLIRKIQKAIAFLGRADLLELPEKLTDSDSLPIDLKALGYKPVGMVSPDGYTFGREITKENVDALGYASPQRSDVTAVPRTVSMTALQHGQRHMLELKHGTDLSGIVQGLDGEIVFDEPDLPVDHEYRLIVIGTDGPASTNWILGKGYPIVTLQATGDESWGQEGARSDELTFDVYNDDTIGTPVRHYLGGTGALKHRDVLGFTLEAAPAWEASTAYEVGDFVLLSTGETLRATAAGTSDATEPTAPLEVGGTVVDGDVTWERIA